MSHIVYYTAITTIIQSILQMIWDKPKRIIDAEHLYEVLQERINMNQDEWDQFQGPTAKVPETHVVGNDQIYSDESD
jgi:hypothetical protein